MLFTLHIASFNPVWWLRSLIIPLWTKVGEWRVRGQTEVHNKTLSQKKIVTFFVFCSSYIHKFWIFMFSSPFMFPSVCDFVHFDFICYVLIAFPRLEKYSSIHSIHKAWALLVCLPQDQRKDTLTVPMFWRGGSKRHTNRDNKCVCSCFLLVALVVYVLYFNCFLWLLWNRGLSLEFSPMSFMFLSIIA
jgi:hypothetical protein